MARAWLSLGANLGDAERQLADATARLAAMPGIEVIAVAPFLQTPAWGRTDQPDFFNTAIAIETTLSPLDLLGACQEIEAALGRERREHWGPRRIDIDIVAYERIVLRSVRLTLPHPWAHERTFVLDPLRAIAPEVAEWLLATGSVGA